MPHPRDHAAFPGFGWCCLTTCALAAGDRAWAAPPESAARKEPRAPVACRLHARVRLLRGAGTELLGLVLQDEGDL